MDELFGLGITNRGSPSVLLQEDSVIDQKFVIRRVVGVGGQGQVYDATQVSFDRRVALKLLRASLDDVQAHTRFLREAQTLSAIRHRNLPLFFGYGMWEGHPYMAIEWLDGVSLENYVRTSGRCSVREALSIAIQSAEGLSCAHEAGIVHRDIKPDNLMISHENGSLEVKLVDFGLCGFAPDSGTTVQQLTDAGSAIGTVYYMSPEQCVGTRATPLSDIYALGCVLYFCLTGNPPYSGDAAITLMLLHSAQPLPRLRCDDLSATRFVAELQKVLDRATEKTPSDRYASCDELLVDLRRLLEQGQQFDTTLTVEGPTVERLDQSANVDAAATLKGADSKTFERRKAAWLANTAMGLLLVAAIVLGVCCLSPDTNATINAALFKVTNDFGPQVFGEQAFVGYFLNAAGESTSTQAEELVSDLYDWSTRPRSPVSVLGRAPIAWEKVRRLRLVGEQAFSKRLAFSMLDDIEPMLIRELEGISVHEKSILPERWRRINELAKWTYLFADSAGVSFDKQHAETIVMLGMASLHSGLRADDFWARLPASGYLSVRVHTCLEELGTALSNRDFDEALRKAVSACALDCLGPPGNNWMEPQFICSRIVDVERIAPTTEKQHRACASLLGAVHNSFINMPDSMLKATYQSTLGCLASRLDCPEFAKYMIDLNYALADKLGKVDDDSWLGLFEGMQTIIFQASAREGHKLIDPRALLSTQLNSASGKARLRAHLRLVWCHVDGNRKQGFLQAMSDLERELGLNHASPDFRASAAFPIAFAYTKFYPADADKAIEKFESLSRNDEERALSNWMRGRALSAQGKPKEAAAYMNKELDFLLDNPSAKIFAAFELDCLRIGRESGDRRLQRVEQLFKHRKPF